MKRFWKEAVALADEGGWRIELDGRWGLVDRRDARGDHKIDIVAAAGPAQQRVPVRGLRGDELGRAIGAVAEEVAGAIGGEALGEAAGFGCDAVDRGIGEAGQRHGARVERFARPVPLGRDRLGERRGRQRELGTGRGADRTAVEFDPPLAVVRGDGGSLFPEALHLRSVLSQR